MQPPFTRSDYAYYYSRNFYSFAGTECSQDNLLILPQLIHNGITSHSSRWYFVSLINCHGDKSDALNKSQPLELYSNNILFLSTQVSHHRTHLYLRFIIHTSKPATPRLHVRHNSLNIGLNRIRKHATGYESSLSNDFRQGCVSYDGPGRNVLENKRKLASYSETQLHPPTSDGWVSERLNRYRTGE